MLKRSMICLGLTVLVTAVLVGGSLLRTTLAEADVPVYRTVAETSHALADGCETTEEKAMAVYRYLCGTMDYDTARRDAILQQKAPYATKDPEQTLRTGKGICVDIALLYGALMQEAGVPVKLVRGYCGTECHAWNRVYDSEKKCWLDVDVTMHLEDGKFQYDWPSYEGDSYIPMEEMLYTNPRTVAENLYNCMAYGK